MKKHFLMLLLSLSCFVFFPAWIRPDEGMWLPTQLDKLPWQEMQRRGLELSPRQIFDTSATALTRSIVLLPGGTGGFVSADGLIITNHHIAFAGIQSVSSVEDDYLKNGISTTKREDELSLPTYTAQFVTQITDVTGEVIQGLSETLANDARADSIRTRVASLTDRYRKSAEEDTDYQISDTYNGNRYLLFRFGVVRDIRLVYAPPGSIGVYGGEVDNWTWPRHTGDFAFLRAYVAPDGKHATYSKNNVPYHPTVFLPISNKPLKEGSFAMIMGFPGRTYRYRTAAEIQLAHDELLPLQINLMKKRIDIIVDAGKRDRAVEIKYAAGFRSLANAFKNYEGTLEGMRRSNIIQERQARERAFAEFLRTKPELEGTYGTVLADIAKTYEDYKKFDQKQIVLQQLAGSSNLLQLANAFLDVANSFKKDSTGHEAPSEKKLSDLQKRIPTTYKNMDLAVDRDLLSAMILAASEIPPPEQQVKALRNIVGDKDGETRKKHIREFVEELQNDSRLQSQDGAMELLKKSADDIRNDKFVKFAAEVQKDNNEIQAPVAAFNATIGRLRGKLIQAWMAWKGDNLYPDANRTLRFTHGEVKTYKPRDAVSYNYITSLTGVMEKETGEDPFIVPKKLRELWEKKDFGPYTDPILNDVPIAFTANLDITGGNSGSPIINGKGELIGVAFDGNWEAVVGDYLFQEPLNRCISVDSRYVLFLLDKFSNAQNIVNELVIHSGDVGGMGSQAK